ncbi:hypothetical protein Mth01_56150 [Sphaerimonospora thailandensis]|uniref:DUF6571 domain-containing protein n=2 Tax=Sphaerimonospora thailandensis TaxID=795644 RepID=A0A8J3RGB7_9ACTN|nr:hypothetical protein Mth01_56150 [Sphaerimonospora thailandensis]
MDDFERGLGRAQDALGRNEPQLRRVLQQLNLDTSRLGALREVQSWIGTTRPDLRRRSETIRSEQTEWATSSGVPGGLTAFNEELYGKAAHDPDVYAAVGKLTEAARSGEVDEKTVAALEKRMGDQTFAVTLMNALGAAGFRNLMTKTVNHQQDKNVARLQTALGKTLGTASAKLSPAWRDELTDDLGRSTVDWRSGYGLALALKDGTFDSAFLVAVARKIDTWKWTAYNAPTIGMNLMEALSRNPAAAQDFFAGDPKMMERYLTWQTMPDGGAALGKALEAATLTFRDHDGSPQQPSRGYLSAKLTSEFIHLEAQRIDEESSPGSRVPPTTTGHILAGYIADVNRIATDAGNTKVPDVTDVDNPNLPGQDPWGPQFKREELHAVMKETFVDAKAFTTVMAAQTAYAGRLLDHGAAQMAAGQGDRVFVANAGWIGAGFGFIADAAGLAKIEQGKELDEAQQRNMKILTATLNTGLAIPQSGAWPITAGVVGAWTGLIEDSVKGDAEDKARDEANSAVRQTHDLIQDLTAQAMLKHGLFGSADPPAPTHPWASLQDLKKGDDPRDNPRNFLKDDGRTLMTRDEMIDETTSGNQEKRLEAYKRWIHGGLAGERWDRLRDRLDHGFSDGFVHYAS